ncbi:lipoprotein [Spiroplasma endosymbiont of Polydrusus pterygomalis]|uniref:lipoprotein n=1 Tax=Spiroplasma endosymbiont of Polydrusus pterygomalis TaxID=3139327 RepID=UPI003CCAFFD1
MKKLISILGAFTITSSAIPTVIAAAPYQSEETILKRNKRWGEVQWIQIAQEWRNAELAYQRAGENFQRNQNHKAFSKAEQRFLEAQRLFNNSKNKWQQGLTQWANQIAQERSQQWWNNNNSSQAHNNERQWVHNKINNLNNKLGISVNLNKVDQLLQQKWNKRNKREIQNCGPSTGVVAAGFGIGGIFNPFFAAMSAILGLVSAMCFLDLF